MTTKKLTKLLALYLPYILLGLVATNFGEAWRLAEGKELGDKIMSMVGTLPLAFANPLPSLHPLDLLIGFFCGAGLRLAVYLRSKNAKKYRHGMEYGSARWGTPKDIEPFQAPKFADNIILTKTERLMMSNRPPDPKNARNKNVLVVGGSGSGKTRFWLKPNLLQCHSSYVVTDPKGTIVLECGQAMLKNGYKVKILNTINFKKSMHYNPFSYVHSEKDILKLVTTLMTNTKGEGSGGDPFWEKSERLLLTALIAYGALTKYGTDIPLAACGIVMKTNAIILAIVVGISQGMQPIVGFEAGGNFMFYGEDADKVAKIINSALFTRATALGEVQVTGFPPRLWARKSKELWSAGNDVYLAGLNENGTHHQTKHLRKEDYLPIGSVINMDGREFRIDGVDFYNGKVSLQDMALADVRMPIFREESLSIVRELYEQQDEVLDAAPEKVPDYKVGDSVVVELPTRTIEGKVGYVGEIDVRINTSTQGYSWSNEVLSKQQFEDSLRRDEPTSDESLDKLPISVEVNGEWQTFPDAAAADEALNAEPVPEAAGNFRITDDHLGEGGAKQKYARNIAAIRTLFQLEQEHRGATAEEQEVLSQYVGWGGLPDAFDDKKDSWAKEYTELKGLLSEEEYTAARASTLNAHYTSPVVIRSIYSGTD